MTRLAKLLVEKVDILGGRRAGNSDLNEAYLHDQYDTSSFHHRI
jgi:hypothetical protein